MEKLYWFLWNNFKIDLYNHGGKFWSATKTFGEYVLVVTTRYIGFGKRERKLTKRLHIFCVEYNFGFISISHAVLKS